MDVRDTVVPITPDEARASRLTTIPSAVIACFNAEIASNLRGKRATVSQPKIVSAICTAMPGASRSAIFDNGWLDVDPLYERAGWKVIYNKPGYNENYDASWVFEAP